MNWWKRSKLRFEKLKEDYGKIAIWTYLGLFVSVWSGFFVAIKLGYSVEGDDGTGGIFLTSWLATKVTQPARIAATVVLTPIVAKVLRKEPKVQAATEDA